jgi:hypothetical protein
LRGLFKGYKMWSLEREDNMAKFRCLASGNIVEFTQQVDIDSMEGHDGYEWVDEEEYVEEEETPKPTVKKRMGRPPKNRQE